MGGVTMNIDQEGMQRATIPTAQRIYEFRPEGLRLSLMTMAHVHQAISAAFNFQAAQIGTPGPVAGPVPLTIPPGLVFNFGSTRPINGVPTPIRFLHIEARRIVFNVAGPSSAIDVAFEQLLATVAPFPSPDGSPVIDVPERVRDYSEITRPAVYHPEALISAQLRDLIQPALQEAYPQTTLELAPSIRVTMVSPEAEYEGLPQTGTGIIFSYEPRAGSHLADQIYFSAASLPTDAHLALRDRVEAALTEQSHIV